MSVTSCSRQTSTSPILSSSRSTQTEALELRRHDVATSTSPDPGDLGLGRRLAEMERVTGYIIIQKFMSRNDAEFQEFLRIRFPTKGRTDSSTSPTHFPGGGGAVEAAAEASIDTEPRVLASSAQEASLLSQSVNETGLGSFEAALDQLQDNENDDILTAQVLLKDQEEPGAECCDSFDEIPCECYAGVSEVGLDKSEAKSLDRQDSPKSASSATFSSSLDDENDESDDSSEDSVPPNPNPNPTRQKLALTIGTQTDQVLLMMTSDSPDSRPSSSSTTDTGSVNVLDVQLRVEKLDLRVRVGKGRGQKVRIPLPKIDFSTPQLQVKGRRLGPQQQGSPTSTKLPKL